MIKSNKLIPKYLQIKSKGRAGQTKKTYPLAVATSIDAFAVGVGFAAMEANIVVAALLIGCTTFTLSAIGVKVGAVFGDKYRAVSERIGGLVLILIGLKTLIQSFL